MIPAQEIPQPKLGRLGFQAKRKISGANLRRFNPQNVHPFRFKTGAATEAERNPLHWLAASEVGQIAELGELLAPLLAGRILSSVIEGAAVEVLRNSLPANHSACKTGDPLPLDFKNSAG